MDYIDDQNPDDQLHEQVARTELEEAKQDAWKEKTARYQLEEKHRKALILLEQLNEAHTISEHTYYKNITIEIINLLKE